jgi:histone H3/H4
MKYFEIYIPKLLKNTIPNYSITCNAKEQLNSVVCIVAHFLAEKSIKLAFCSEKKTISSKQIENSLRLYFTPNLYQLLVQNANIAVEKFSSLTTEEKYLSRQKRSGLVFPPALAEKFLRYFGYSKVMVTKTAPVFFASILENIVIEILSSAVKTISKSHKRITIRDLEIGIRKDFELDKLFTTLKISLIGGGVIPDINEALINKKPRRKKAVNFMDKKYRFRLGTISLREIKKYQKTSDCLIFARLPFSRFVRDAVQRHKNIKISKNTFTVTQYYIEQFVTDLLKDANKVAIHSSRIKVLPEDIKLVLSLRKSP